MTSKSKTQSPLPLARVIGPLLNSSLEKGGTGGHLESLLMPLGPNWAHSEAPINLRMDWPEVQAEGIGSPGLLTRSGSYKLTSSLHLSFGHTQPGGGPWCIPRKPGRDHVFQLPLLGLVVGQVEGRLGFLPQGTAAVPWLWIGGR